MRNAPPPNKKRKIKTITEEKIDFDPAAREEYLTGFHKRKLARRKHAEEENAKKEKEEKLRFRREVRFPPAPNLQRWTQHCCSTKAHTHTHTHTHTHDVHEEGY
jgi:ribosomal RNA-processing protein 17